MLHSALSPQVHIFNSPRLPLCMEHAHLKSIALLLYDVLLTSGREYQYIWQSGKSRVSRALYVWNRYITLLYLLLDLGTIPSMSDTVSATVLPHIQSELNHTSTEVMRVSNGHVMYCLMPGLLAAVPRSAGSPTFYRSSV